MSLISRPAALLKSKTSAHAAKNAGRSSGDDGSGVSKTPSSAAPVRKFDETLASVVRETAVPAAVELLKENTRFAFPSGTAWAGLLLSAQAIGGLSQRHRRDADKGSLIELISSDQITTVATAEMLDQDVFGIIPTPETLERMDEFSLLRDAEYAWCVLWQDETGELVIQVKPGATFAAAQQVSAGRLDLEQAVGSQAWIQNGGVRGSVADDQMSASGADNPWLQDERAAADDKDAVSTDAGEFDEGAPVFGDEEPGGDASVDLTKAEQSQQDSEVAGEFDDDVVFGETGDPSDHAEPVDASEGFDEDERGDTGDFGTEDEDADGFGAVDDDEDVQHVSSDTGQMVESAVEPAGEVATAQVSPQTELAVVDEPAVRETLSRRFLHEGIELEVNLDELTAGFATGVPMVTIEPPEGVSGWLGEQIAVACASANTQLRQLREHHEHDLRTMYVALMSEHVQSVLESVSTATAGSVYATMLATLERNHDDRTAGLTARMEADTRKVRDDFEARVRAEAERAAADAASRYRTRYAGVLDRQVADVSAAAQAQVEAAYDDDRAKLLAAQKREAEYLLEIGRTQVNEVLSQSRDKHLKAEAELMERWSDSIMQILDQHRKQDVARVETLAQQQARTDEVAQLTAEQEKQLAQLGEQHAARVEQLTADLQRSRQEAADELEARSQAWKHDLDLEKQRTAHEIARSRDLQEQLSALDAVYRSRYEDRHAELEADKASFARGMEQTNTMQTRSMKILAVLVLVTALLCLAAGFIVGSLVS